MSFGAAGDGISDDTQAFKKAWDAACRAESSATLLVPQVHSFMIRSTTFERPCKNDILFQIDGTIVAPDGPTKWSAEDSKLEWLVFKTIHGMTMQGSGVIDGKGEKWWNLPCKHVNEGSHCDSPTAIRFASNSKLTMRGLRIKNSPKFHIILDNCEDIHVEFLTISSPADSPNTDGIHLANTNNVKIYHSTISTGDDCISIGTGSHDVDIKHATCGPSHGMSIGSLGRDKSRDCVSNITVSDSIIQYSDYGVRIKTWQGGSGSVSQVTFDNIRMDTVQNPIIINQYYCLTEKCHNQTSALMISNIMYRNIIGTYETSRPPMHLACSDSMPCMNITLSEVKSVPSDRGNRKTKKVLKPFC